MAEKLAKLNEIFSDSEKWNRLANTIFSINLQIFSLAVGSIMIIKEIAKPTNDFRNLKFLSFETEIPIASYIFILVVLTNFGIVYGAKLLDKWIKKDYSNIPLNQTTTEVETQPLVFSEKRKK